MRTARTEHVKMAGVIRRQAKVMGSQTDQSDEGIISDPGSYLNREQPIVTVMKDS